jgi:excisionase family DNA binding protein
MRRDGDDTARSGVERLTVTVTQAGVMLGISRTSAYERVRRGEIPTVRLGRRLVVPKTRLIAMLEDEPPAAPTSEDEAA